MTEYSDRAFVADFENGLHHRCLVLALADGEDLLGLCRHPVQVEAKQIGFHEGKAFGKVVHVSVPMVKIVDDAYVLVALLVKRLANRDQVGGFASPTAMVVESQLESESLALLN